MCCSLRLANLEATTGAMQHAEPALGDKIATQPVHVSKSQKPGFMSMLKPVHRNNRYRVYVNGRIAPVVEKLRPQTAVLY